MTIREALIKATKLLAKTKHLSPMLDGEVLLSFVLNKSKPYVFANPDHKIRPSQAKKFMRLLSKRALGLPVAYLVGQKEFFGLNFTINTDVLVPRPETETLVEIIIERLKDKQDLKILDVGTGSGCIIISLAKKLGKDNSYFASDVSSKALVVAKKNTKLHQVKITFRQGNLLAPWKNLRHGRARLPREKFDIIVANLPYGWKEWKNNTSAPTIGLKYEPPAALFTKQNGLYLIDNLLKQIAMEKHKPQAVFLEFDPRQTQELKKLIRHTLPKFKVMVLKDLSGRNRVLQLVNNTTKKPLQSERF